MANIKARIHDSEELLTYPRVNRSGVENRGGNLVVTDPFHEDFSPFGKWVRVIAGTTYRAYGGPEEGGWWYDAFLEAFRLPVYAHTEEELVSLLEKVDALLSATQEEFRTEIRIASGSWPEFHPPQYE